MRRQIRRAVDWATTTGDRFTAWGTRLLAGHGMGIAWLVVGCLAAVPLLGFGVIQAASVVAHEERTETTTIDLAASGATGLVVDNDAGSVTVVGVEDSDAVVVRANVSEGLRATGHQITTRDDKIFVRGSCPIFGSEWCSVDYTVEVPDDLFVDVAGSDGVSVSDVAGGLVADSDTGTLELVRVGGDVTASSDQGRVDARELTASRVDARADQGRVTLEFVESPQHIVAEADQGSIDIVLPVDEDVFYALYPEADQGSVSNRVNTKPTSDRSITAKADQGSITIRYATP
jgi:hypothetical protein